MVTGSPSWEISISSQAIPRSELFCRKTDTSGGHLHLNKTALLIARNHRHAVHSLREFLSINEKDTKILLGDRQLIVRKFTFDQARIKGCISHRKGDLRLVDVDHILQSESDKIALGVR